MKNESHLAFSLHLELNLRFINIPGIYSIINIQSLARTNFQDYSFALHNSTLATSNKKNKKTKKQKNKKE